jgi:hypothetical protein
VNGTTSALETTDSIESSGAAATFTVGTGHMGAPVRPATPQKPPE